MISRSSRIRRRRRKSLFGRRRTPEREAEYLDFIREQECLTCGSWPVEAAHTGPHGMSQKASDFTAVPLCAWCHREGPHSNHKLGRNWAAHHGIDLEAVRSKLLLDYEHRRLAA